MAAPGAAIVTSRVRDAVRHHEVLASGILAGVLGGLAMAAVAMIGAASQGIAPLHPLRIIGESFIGPAALNDLPMAKVAYGAIVHLATSVGFGVLVAAIVPRDFALASAIGVGVGFALFALMFMMSVVVPWANPGLRDGMQDLGGAWVIAHAFFGVAAGCAPALRRWAARGASDAPAAGADNRIAPRAEPVAPPRTT